MGKQNKKMLSAEHMVTHSTIVPFVFFFLYPPVTHSFVSSSLVVNLISVGKKLVML